MKKYVLTICHFILAVSLALGIKIYPKVNVDILVVDEQGNSVENAVVSIAFPGRTYDDDETDAKTTGEDGNVSFSGRSVFWPSIGIKKDGYYSSHRKVHTFEWDNKKKKNVYRDRNITVVLRPIKNPVPMYAYKKVLAKIPVLHMPVGFDMTKADWVSPYGQGLVTDFILEVTGDWNGYRDHDSLLKLSFPNEGDGYALFDANNISQFRSPYEAPLFNYTSTKSWRKKTRPIEGKKFEWDNIDETSSAKNYILRVRTVLDENNEVKKANYGKIYDDFKFSGATLDDRYGYIEFSYYLNPTPNDRNLEFDLSKNLLKNLESPERVREP